MLSGMRLVDLSHVIDDGMITYPGLPGPAVETHMSFSESAAHYAPGTEFAIGRITMVANTGTYLDTPAHRFRTGHDLADLPLDRCAHLPAVVVDAPASGPIDRHVLTGYDLAGTAVLLRTGWDRHWGGPHYGDPAHPHLTAEAAGFLVDSGAVLVGIDSVNIDDTAGRERPAHTSLLAAAIPVVEHLTNLNTLPRSGAVFTAAPPAVRGLATFPVRCVAAVP